MTAENEPRPDEQASEQEARNETSAGGEAAVPDDVALTNEVQAIRDQQEATTRGLAELTSQVSQLLEKMASAVAPGTAQAAPTEPPETPTESAATPEEPADEPQVAETPQPADTATTVPASATPDQPPDEAASAQPVPVAPEAPAPQAQAVTPPPVDPAAYAQTIPAAGFPQGASQAGAPTGFPVAGQPQNLVPGGFPVMQDPQAPMPQAPVPQAQVPQAAPALEGVRQTVRVARDLVRGRRAAPGQVGPPQAQQAPQPIADNRWQQILFGPDLANNQALAALRDKVLEGLLGGERASTGLAGTILLFQASAPDRMPQILKDVGEAYYRWNPRTALGDDPLRNALITWLHRKCEASGVSNTIVIVRPGDRFESSRHNAKQRGVEVTQVFGWVVLRDNGKVYTKATVAVK